MAGGRHGQGHGLLANTYYVIGIAHGLGIPGAIVIAVGVLAGWAGGFYQAARSQLPPALVDLVPAAVVAFLLVFVSALMLVRAWRRLRRVASASDHGFNVAARFSAILGDLLHDRTAYQSAGPLALERFLQREYLSLQLLLNEISDFFGQYTGRPCHASLKLIEFDQRKLDVYIRTAIRDGKPSSENRKNADKSLPTFRYRDNTAFETIMTDKAVRWYVRNHLRREQALGRYHNARPSWWHDYTATLVVPITDQRNPEMIDRHTIVGFLCIDNKGGGFDEAFCANVAFAFARITHGILQMFFTSPIEGEGR
jgi:hypothetical protein